jgi:TonB family protein
VSSRSTWHGVRLALWAMWSMALFASAATTAQNLQTEAGLRASMQRLTDTYNGIRDARDKIVVTPSRMTRDSHGRTLCDDVRENVLVASVRERLDSLLRAAGDSLSAHDLPSADSSLTQVATILEREGKTYDAIIAYWKRNDAQRPNRSRYLKFLRVNGLEDRYSSEIEAAEGSFEQQIEAREFVGAMYTTVPLLRLLYDKAAEEEGIQIRSAMERRDFVPFRTEEGSVKCAHATRRTSGSALPSMVSSLSIRDYYPPVSRQLGEEGRILMDVLVARNGCAARAYVTVSSGYERLDTAALSYALQASYRPAEINGRLAATRIPLTLKFELRDE